MQQILTMISKEFKQIFRDKAMLAIIFLVPVIQLFILAYSITTDVTHIKLLIADMDNSQTSREIVRSFSHTGRFDIVENISDLRRIRSEFQSWKAQMVIQPELQ